MNAAKCPELAVEALGPDLPRDVGIPAGTESVRHHHCTWFKQRDGTAIVSGEHGDEYLKDFAGALRHR